MQYQWEQVTRPEGYDIFPGMDPAANWLILGPGSSAFFQYISVEQGQAIEEHMDSKTEPLTNANGVLIPSMFENISVPVVFDIPKESAADVSVFDVSEALRVDPSRLSSGYFFTTPLLLDNLFNSDDVLFANSEFRQSFAKTKASFKLCAPFGGDPVTDPVFTDGPNPEVPAGGWPEDAVIMAVIDDGLGFANHSFRDSANKSRFQYLWWQDTEASGGAGVPFGVEISKSGIDALISASQSDEDVYRAFGTMDFKRNRRSTVALGLTHGTHVLDVAAGYDQIENRRDRPIIGVQLWQEAVERGTGAELECYILAAVEYILTRAGQISESAGRSLPVVINLSYGFNLGPHDGTSQFEQNLSTLIDGYNLSGGGASIVISAGNNHLTRTHSEITFNSAEPVQPKSLQWQVLPEDRTSTTMEIWLPYDKEVEEKNTDFLVDAARFIDERFVFSLTTPSGLTSPLIPCQHGAGVKLKSIVGIETHQVAEAKYCFVPGETCRGMVRISLTPTAILAVDNGPWREAEVSPSGVWIVGVARKAFTPDEIVRGTVETIKTWILRDDEVYGYPSKGQQSYFVNECYEVYDPQGREIIEDPGGDCPIRRKTLINAAATGENVNVVGSYYEREEEQTEYSAGGPKVGAKNEVVNPSFSRKPDLLAAAEGSKVHFGVLAAGSMSGSVKPMGGTSVAAPIVARRIADEISNSGNPNTAMSSVIGGLTTSSSTTDERGGFGMLEPFHRVKVERFIKDSTTIVIT